MASIINPVRADVYVEARADPANANMGVEVDIVIEVSGDQYEIEVLGEDTSPTCYSCIRDPKGVYYKLRYSFRVGSGSKAVIHFPSEADWEPAGVVTKWGKYFVYLEIMQQGNWGTKRFNFYRGPIFTVLGPYFWHDIPYYIIELQYPPKKGIPQRPIRFYIP